VFVCCVLDLCVCAGVYVCLLENVCWCVCERERESMCVFVREREYVCLISVD